MPELPEVEIFRRYFASTSLNKKITGIELPDVSILGNISANKFVQVLNGNKFTDTARHGKYMFAEINKHWLVLHFGMTAFLKYFKNEERKPGHVKLLVKFANNYALAYDCMRKLGVVDLTDNLDKFVENQKLGKDPLHDDFKLEEFKEIIDSARGSLKSFFMNQKHIAGLGNVYFDELLFLTSLHPKSDIGDIEAGTVGKLYRNMNKIIKKAIDVGAKRKNFPRTYLINHREDGAACPRCKGKIKQIKVSGRSTYFCIKHQKEI